ncbi:MAG: hypothetical protein WDO74_17065 [Pseudomonadota bacterium]
MARIAPHVVATRLTLGQLQETSAAAQARGLSVSEYTRGALRAACVAVLSAEGYSPEGKLAAIADLLELPKGATAEQIVAAIGELNGPDAPPAQLATLSTTRGAVQAVERIARAAAKHRIAPPVFVQRAMTLLSSGATARPDPEGVLADLTKALGLPEYSAPADVLAALKDLFEALSPASTADPLAAGAEPPPPAQLSTLSMLAKRGWTPERITALSATEREVIAKRGWTPEQLAAESKRAVRRV